MKELILLRGVSGAGKSTLAGLISPANVAADDYFFDDEGNYNFNPKKLKQAHQWCQDSVEKVMELGLLTVAVHNTFTQEWEMKPYFDLAEKYGYRVHTIIVENRHGGENVHNVPSEVIDKMRKRFEVKL